MRQLARVGLVVFAVLVLLGRANTSGSPPLVANTSVTASLKAGDDGEAIAERFADPGVWSQTGFSCRTSSNVLIVTDNTGDCDQPESRYEFDPDPDGDGLLDADHDKTLEIDCSSPLVASMELDMTGLTVLSVGVNTFVSGPDTILVTFGLVGPKSALPAMPAWASVLLAALVLGVGALLLRRARVATPRSG